MGRGWKIHVQPVWPESNLVGKSWLGPSWKCHTFYIFALFITPELCCLLLWLTPPPKSGLGLDNILPTRIIPLLLPTSWGGALTQTSSSNKTIPLLYGWSRIWRRPLQTPTETPSGLAFLKIKFFLMDEMWRANIGPCSFQAGFVELPRLNFHLCMTLTCAFLCGLS